MSLNSDLTAIKNIQDGVKNNKVTRFAYTQTAYTNNDVNGHDDYVATRDNNIPLSDLSVIEVNQTVVDKGFRARASALNRMFLNHLFGRVSYNLNKINDLFNELLVKLMANLGVADGLATLDSTGRIPYSQLPEDAMEYQGDWNASTNTPTLVDGTGTKGDTYNVSVAGDQTFGGVSVHFNVGDRVIYNGSIWQRFESGAVQSVCEILPDPVTANVDLSKQEDITKIFNHSFLRKLLLFTIGKAWWRANVDTSNGMAYNVCYHDGLWLLLKGGSGRDIYYTTKELGYVWQLATGTIKGGSTPMFIGYAGNKFFASYYNANGSPANGLNYSNDGMTWQPVDTNISRVINILYKNGVYVGIATATNGLIYSTDGVNWTKVYNYTFLSLSLVNGLFVAFGNIGVYTSEDGINWSNPSNPALMCASYFYKNKYYCFERQRTAKIRSSSDLTNWTVEYTGSSEGQARAEYYNTVFFEYKGYLYCLSYANPYDSNTNKIKILRTDGNGTWQEIETPFTTALYIDYTIVEEVLVLAVASQGVWKTTDLAVWEKCLDGITARYIDSSNEHIVVGTDNTSALYGAWDSNYGLAYLDGE